MRHVLRRLVTALLVLGLAPLWAPSAATAGSSEGPYLESSGACSDRDYVRDGLKTASIEADIVRAAGSLPDVDSRRIIVVGQSAGGFGAIALGDAPPAGVIGIINFAGGRGGDDHEHTCSGVDRLTQAAHTFGSENQVSSASRVPTI